MCPPQVEDLVVDSETKKLLDRFAEETKGECDLNGCLEALATSIKKFSIVDQVEYKMLVQVWTVLKQRTRKLVKKSLLTKIANAVEYVPVIGFLVAIIYGLQGRHDEARAAALHCGRMTLLTAAPLAAFAGIAACPVVLAPFAVVGVTAAVGLVAGAIGSVIEAKVGDRCISDPRVKERILPDSIKTHVKNACYGAISGALAGTAGFLAGEAVSVPLGQIGRTFVGTATTGAAMGVATGVALCTVEDTRQLVVTLLEAIELKQRMKDLSVKTDRLLVRLSCYEADAEDLTLSDVPAQLAEFNQGADELAEQIRQKVAKAEELLRKHIPKPA